MCTTVVSRRLFRCIMVLSCAKWIAAQDSGRKTFFRAAKKYLRQSTYELLFAIGF